MNDVDRFRKVSDSFEGSSRIPKPNAYRCGVTTESYSRITSEFSNDNPRFSHRL